MKDNDPVRTRLRHAFGRTERLAVQIDLTGADVVKSRNGVQQRGLSAPGWTDDDAELSGLDFKGAVVQGQNIGTIGIINFL